MDWNSLSIDSRRALLRMADLWDGNTYTAQPWEQLPKHIQGDLEISWLEMEAELEAEEYQAEGEAAAHLNGAWG